MDQRIQELEQRIRILEKKFNDIDGFLIHLSSLRIKERLEKMHRDVSYLNSWVLQVNGRLNRVEEKLLTPPEHAGVTEDDSLPLDTTDDNYSTDVNYLNNLQGNFLKQGAPKKKQQPKQTKHTGFQTRKIF